MFKWIFRFFTEWFARLFTKMREKKKSHNKEKIVSIKTDNQNQEKQIPFKDVLSPVQVKQEGMAPVPLPVKEKEVIVIEAKLPANEKPSSHDDFKQIEDRKDLKVLKTTDEIISVGSNSDSIKIEEKSKVTASKLSEEITKKSSENSSEKNDTSEISIRKSNWFIVAASVAGKSHLKTKTPCQDSYYFERINAGWGIAICCDGAGSATNSHLGSKLVASEIGAKYFKTILLDNEWHNKNSLPTIDEWTQIARKGFSNIYSSLQEVAESEQIELDSLACTAIVVIYSPVGLLVTHIGDGRAGYCNSRGEWKSMMVPHKGEEANQTIFVTSEKWITQPDFCMSGVHVPENRVINLKPQAFTLMTDGCERHSFECSVLDKKTKTLHDPNLPFPDFFNPLKTSLKEMYQNKVSNNDANNLWQEFIDSGNKGLKAEPDDKTMILSISI